MNIYHDMMRNHSDMLEGCRNRIFVSDDIEEIERCKESAIHRINQLAKLRIDFLSGRIDSETKLSEEYLWDKKLLFSTNISAFIPHFYLEVRVFCWKFR